MNILFFGLVVVLTVAGAFFSDRTDSTTGPSWKSIIYAVGIGSLLTLLAFFLPDSGLTQKLWLGNAAGVLCGVVLVVLARYKSPLAVVPIGLATVVATSAFSISQGAGFGVVFGAAFVGLMTGLESVGCFVLVATGVYGATFLSSGPQVSDLGLKLGAVVTATAMVASFLKKLPTVGLVATTLGCIGALALVWQPTSVSSYIGICIPPLAGLAVHQIIGTGDKKQWSGGHYLAVVLWVAVATSGFLSTRSAGMTMSLVAAVGVPMILGNYRAVGSAAPFVSLVWYRLVKQGDPDLVRASDLATFYLFMGLVFGAALCALAWDSREKEVGEKGVFVGSIWGALGSGLALIIQAIFDFRGLTGFVCGSGLSVLSGLREKNALVAVCMSALVGSAAASLYPWVDKISPETHDGKMRMFFFGGLALVAAVAGLYFIQKPSISEAKP